MYCLILWYTQPAYYIQLTSSCLEVYISDKHDKLVRLKFHDYLLGLGLDLLQAKQ